MAPDEKSKFNQYRKYLFWDLWKLKSTEEDISSAEEVLRQVYFRGREVPEAKKRQALADLDALLDQEEARKNHLRPGFSGWWQLAAAVLMGVLITSAAFWLLRGKEDTRMYATRYGEQRVVELPDHSVVSLNANSTLRFRDDWSQANIPREVWLDGEAFFSVQKQEGAAGPVKFIVHTNDLDVEVLGTRFNVSNRMHCTQVVLEEGKVQLNLKNQDAVAGQPQVLLMEPGQLVEYSLGRHNVTKKTVNPAVFASWKDNQLVFDNTPLAQVASLIEHTYGLKVVVEDSTLLRKKITGTIRSDNLERLLEALSLSFAIQIKRNNQEVIFKKPN